MTRKLLICSLVALCLGAAGAPAAQASPELHSEAEHTILTGQQSAATQFSFDDGALQCGTFGFDGTLAVATTPTFLLTPTFQNCAVDNMEAVFTPNGCKWMVHVGPNEEHLTGAIDFVCPDNEVMEFHYDACLVTVFPQAGLQTVTFTNGGAEATRGVELDLNLVGIHYREHGMGCANPGETTNNGNFQGKVRLTGESTGGVHRGIWIE
ncbi:MAG TPA: hypothetical protein VEQ41_01205 [Solirubrobacterales bacterium]|nr:hypothetical protein [Solirubrobacterales bacterium]